MKQYTQYIYKDDAWRELGSSAGGEGTVTSVTLQATSPIAVDDDTAITSSGVRTLSHVDSGVTAGTYKSVTVDAKGHVTAGSNPTTLSGYGITDAKIDNGVVTLGSNTITPLTTHQNTFSKVKVGSTNVEADAAGDTLELVAGSNVTLTPDATNDKVTIAATDTTYTDGTAGYVLKAKQDKDGNSIDTTYYKASNPNGYTSNTGTVTKVTAGAGLNTTSNDTSTDGGDITSTGTLHLTKSGVTAGTYQGLVVDKYGRVTGASNMGYTTNTGTITGITMNGASKGTSGVVDLGTVITSHQSIKTINSNTITGTGNVSVGTITKVQANGTDVASSGTANIPAASTSAYGVTELSSATDSTSEALAATPKAVKAAYDLAASKGTGTITGVSVNGTSVATSGVANITSMPASILSGAIPSAVTATTQSQGDNSTKIATTAYVDTALDNLPDPMVFKGSLGTGGTITALPVDGSANIGDTYKVITAGTYASKTAKVGDTFICLTKTSSANTWELIPSGDEPSGTVTSVTIKATSPIAIDSSSAITTSGERTLSHANSGVTAGTYRSVTVNATGHVTAGTNPTTISGYGITDAKIASGVITLGSDTITPLTASSTLDATKLSGAIPSGCYTNTTYTLSADTTNNKITLTPSSGTANSITVPYATSAGNASTVNNLTVLTAVPANAVFTDTTYESKTAASGGTAVSLVTTGEKYAWNNKSDASNWLNGSATGSVRTSNSASESSSYTIGSYSVTEGRSTKASGTHAHAEGYNTQASGDYSHAEGQSCQASSTFAHAEGNGSIASGSGSHAEGTHAEATASNAHAEGYYTKATSQYSHAEGKNTIANANQCHAEGDHSVAIGGASHAEGDSTFTYNTGSHAEGTAYSTTIATGTITAIDEANLQVTVTNFPQSGVDYLYQLYSPSTSFEGTQYITAVSGYGPYTFTLSKWNSSLAVNGDFSIRYRTTSKGAGAHAEGVATQANNQGSHSEGIGTRATADAQHIEGKWNVTNNNMAHIVGNGTAYNARSNAYTLDWNGNGTYAGKITVGTGPTNNMDVATKKYVDDNSAQNVYVGSTAPSASNYNVWVDSSGTNTVNGDLYVTGDLYINGLKVLWYSDD